MPTYGFGIFVLDGSYKSSPDSLAPPCPLFFCIVGAHHPGGGFRSFDFQLDELGMIELR